MLTIKDLSFRIAGNPLFSMADVYIPAGSKVGIVGRNGTGKTTLFKLIQNEYGVDSGQIKISKGTTLGGVAQEVPSSEETLLATVLKADTERELLLHEEISTLSPERIAEIHERLVDIDAHSAEARASNILRGLGFNSLDQNRSCSQFSGGWRMRVALASVLFSAPDLLLLDEPTNYLDLEGTIWLETFLAKYPKTILLISHDRRILTKSVNKILHLNNQKLTLFSGNYDFFIKSYNETIKLADSKAKKDEAKKAHMQAFVDKFRAKASKAKQAQSRLKALEKMQTIPQLRDSDVSDFYIPATETLFPPILNLEAISIGYGDKVILKNLNLRIDPEDRIALLGANGQGKSTLSKFIAGKIEPFSGKSTKSKKLRVGYFAQHQVDEFILDQTPLEHIADCLPDKPRNILIAQLAYGGIVGDQVSTPVGNLSGGQKSRLAMLLATVTNPHLLILDEPTNHLDIESREKLALSLNKFSGAIILVSHDPYLIDLVATELWLVRDNSVTPFKDDLDAYQKLLLTDQSSKPKVRKKIISNQIEKNITNKTNADANLTFELKKAEARISKLQEMRIALDNHLSDPDIYAPTSQDRLRKLEVKDKELNKAIVLAEKIWLDFSLKQEKVVK